MLDLFALQVGAGQLCTARLLQVEREKRKIYFAVQIRTTPNRTVVNLKGIVSRDWAELAMIPVDSLEVFSIAGSYC